MPDRLAAVMEYGPNALTTERTTAWRVLGRQFQSALIYFLIVAAFLAFATRDLSDGVIITVILLIKGRRRPGRHQAAHRRGPPGRRVGADR